tara:strand:+ start:3966 stop:5783 length:1818 start_codon:yes stop_codon:yes gene_type:complete
MENMLNRLDGVDVDLGKNDDGTTLTVRGLCQELVRLGEKSAANFLVRAERNELFVRGDQGQDIEQIGYQLADIPWNSDIPKVTHNLLRNLVLTWCSRILQDRPSTTAYPTNADIKDIEAARAAQQLIEYFEFENNIDTLMYDTLKNACSHGVGGIKCYYDPKLDEVKWDLVTAFDYYVDNVENPNEAQWCVFKRYVNLYDAKELLKKVNITDVSVSTYTVNELEEREGVEVYEMWYMPDSRVEKGVYALLVDGNVVEHMEYPYVFQFLEDPESGQMRSFLPLCIFKVGYIRGTAYGDTWMNDAVPIQRQINEIESVLTKLRRDTGSVKLLAPGSVIDAWEDSNSMIKMDDPAKAAITKWLDPPKLNPILFEDRDRLERRLYDIAGLNEVLTGAEGAKSGTSAKQISFLSELDNMKHAGTARNIEKFLIQLWKVSLHLVRKYYVFPRILRIVGPADEVGAIYFTGADIDGVDIRLEPRSGMERYSATKGQNVIDRHAQQLENPQGVMERSITGLEMTTQDAELKETILEQAKLVMQGHQVRPLTNVNPAYASQVITGFMEVMTDNGAPPEQVQPLAQLKQLYDQQAAQQAQQVQQMQQPPEGEPIQ